VSSLRRYSQVEHLIRVDSRGSVLEIIMALVVELGLS
jgi:hypothetical protein